MEHLNHHNLHHQFDSMQHLVTTYANKFDWEGIDFYKNYFDMMFLNSLEVNTTEEYQLSRSLLNKHFERCGDYEQSPVHFRSQVQYSDAVHFLNKRMMDPQQYRMHYERIPLLRNGGTSDGRFGRVVYTADEEKYGSANSSAVSHHKLYNMQKLKMNLGKSDPACMNRIIVQKKEEMMNTMVRVKNEEDLIMEELHSTLNIIRDVDDVLFDDDMIDTTDNN